MMFSCTFSCYWLFFFSSRRRHTRWPRDWSSDVCSSDLDVISAYQHGLKNVVATLGTALTERQAQLLRRYTNKIIICYDGDSAGEEASFRAAKVLRPIGFDISIANLDSAEDPDQYILQKGIDKIGRASCRERVYIT